MTFIGYACSFKLIVYADFVKMIVDDKISEIILFYDEAKICIQNANKEYKCYKTATKLLRFY